MELEKRVKEARDSASRHAAQALIDRANEITDMAIATIEDLLFAEASLELAAYLIDRSDKVAHAARGLALHYLDEASKDPKGD